MSIPALIYRVWILLIFKNLHQFMTQNGCDETFIFLSAGPWRTASPLFDPDAPGLRTTYLDVDGWFGALEPSRANTDAGGSRALARGRLHRGAGGARHRARGPHWRRRRRRWGVQRVRVGVRPAQHEVRRGGTARCSSSWPS